MPIKRHESSHATTHHGPRNPHLMTHDSWSMHAPSRLIAIAIQKSDDRSRLTREGVGLMLGFPLWSVESSSRTHHLHVSGDTEHGGINFSALWQRFHELGMLTGLLLCRLLPACRFEVGLHHIEMRDLDEHLATVRRIK